MNPDDELIEREVEARQRWLEISNQRLRRAREEHAAKHEPVWREAVSRLEWHRQERERKAREQQEFEHIEEKELWEQEGEPFDLERIKQQVRDHVRLVGGFRV